MRTRTTAMEIVKSSVSVRVSVAKYKQLMIGGVRCSHLTHSKLISLRTQSEKDSVKHLNYIT